MWAGARLGRFATAPLMSIESIHTNSDAISALRALDLATRDVQEAQAQVSSGLEVAQAKDDSAAWSAAQRMRSDLSSWQSISDGVGRWQSILDVASAGAQQIGDLLQQLQEKALSFSDISLDSASRTALQADMAGLIREVDGVAGNADFNGVNLLNVPETPPTGVNPNGVSGVAGYTAPGAPTVSMHATWTTRALDVWASSPAVATSIVYTSDADGSVQTLTPPPTLAGEQMDPSQSTPISPLGPGTFDVTFSAGNGPFGFNLWGVPGSSTLPPPPSSLLPTPAPPLTAYTDPAGGTIPVSRWDLRSPALGLGSLDWSQPQDVLAAIQGAIATATQTAAVIGSQQAEMSAAAQNVGKAQDSLQNGISRLVDTDMPTESAKLQAAQVKEQLAVKALSIANSEPQWMLNLLPGASGSR